MTASEWAQTVWMAGKAAAVWIALAGVVLLLLILFAQCHGRRVAKDALARQTEEAAAERAGLEVVHAATEKQLQTQLDAALAGMVPGQQAAFSAQLDATRHVLPGAHVASVITASTGPRPVQPAQGAVPHPPGAAPACMFTEDDQGDIRVVAATLQGKAGARVLVGSAEAVRVVQSQARPERWLFGGTFSVPLTEAAEVVPAAPLSSSWGAGLLVGLSSAGTQAGAAVITPEFRPPIVGGRAEGIVTITCGGGQCTAAAGAIWRP